MSSGSKTWVMNWSEALAVRGAAKTMLGVALMLGSVGLISLGMGGVDGSFKGVAGLMVIGSIIFGLGLLIRPKPFEDEVEVQGALIDLIRERSGASSSGTMWTYRPVYGYRVGGVSYRLEAKSSSTVHPAIGVPVLIRYSESNPERARRMDGYVGVWFLIFHGVGVLFLLLAGWQVIGPYALGVGGIIVFALGLVDRLNAEIKASYFRDLFSLISWKELTVGGVPVGASGADGAGAASLPPAGWMVDPDDPGQMRWWDGVAWTDMRKPDGPEQSEMTNTVEW